MRAKEFLIEWTLGGVTDSAGGAAGKVGDVVMDTPTGAYNFFKGGYEGFVNTAKKIAWAALNPLDAIDYGEHERDYWMDTEAGLAVLKERPWEDPQYTKEQRLAFKVVDNMRRRKELEAAKKKDELSKPADTGTNPRRPGRNTGRLSD